MTSGRQLRVVISISLLLSAFVLLLRLFRLLSEPQISALADVYNCKGHILKRFFCIASCGLVNWFTFCQTVRLALLDSFTLRLLRQAVHHACTHLEGQSANGREADICGRERGRKGTSKLSTPATGNSGVFAQQAVAGTIAVLSSLLQRHFSFGGERKTSPANVSPCMLRVHHSLLSHASVCHFILHFIIFAHNVYLHRIFIDKL
ncbi:unnamed protein product [Protopolystoma xenopodis]|uniref:Uncharacterized protein n=1 Tax=Protopolystoma xenopodis TaxID=117903 RepID=A0A448WW68_9PLAT|nr:unnamed protein product [Protopolystoma xenopodis]